MKIAVILQHQILWGYINLDLSYSPLKVQIKFSQIIRNMTTNKVMKEDKEELTGYIAVVVCSENNTSSKAIQPNFFN